MFTQKLESARGGATENVGVENAIGPTVKIAGVVNAGAENAGVEKAAACLMENQRENKQSSCSKCFS